MEISELPEGLCTPAIGLGCWGMSDAYGPADEKESIATIDAALAIGLRHFDTADVTVMATMKLCWAGLWQAVDRMSL